MVRRKINAVVATCAALCVKALVQSRQSRAVKECSGKVRLRWAVVNPINAYLLDEFLLYEYCYMNTVI